MMRSGPLSYQIFISHSEHDRLVAEAFQTMMTTVVGRDPACFVASHSIRSGEDWFTRLNMALREASALVALLTPASLESSWVPYEVGYAHALNKKPLGLTLGLTAKQARTGPYQSIQFRSDEAKDVAEIVKDLCTDYYQLMPDPNLVDEAVGTFRSSIRDHIKTSMDQHAESQQIR